MNERIYRQGDVLIVRVNDDAKTGERVKREGGKIVLAHGEVTGHSHAISSKDAALFAMPISDTNAADRLLRVRRTVMLDHEEHSTISLPPGMYRVTIQRTYEAGEARRVVD